jgi:WS/DGAT/MGAT family acyltransferase
MWVIEGLERGRVAVMLMLHHALSDGVTYSKLMSRLCSAESDPPPPDLLPAAPVPSSVRIAIDGLFRFLRRPFRIAGLLPATLSAVVDSARRAVAGRAMAAPFSAPRTVLNGKLTADRKVSFARLDLADVKKVANHFGVKVNDVALSLVGGQARRFFLERGELPAKSLTALVPVSAHGLSDSTAHNQVSGIHARLQTQIADPVERLRYVAQASAVDKEHSAAMGTLLNDWGEVIGPLPLGLAKRAYARLTRLRPMYNIVVSNVPGPPTPYLLGAAVRSMYSFGPVMLGVGLNVTLYSANGVLHIAVISCPALLPDPRSLADGFAPALQELLDRIGETPGESDLKAVSPTG